MAQPAPPARPARQRITRPIAIPGITTPPRGVRVSLRRRLLTSIGLGLLAAALLGGLYGLFFLDNWTNLGVSWGPQLTPVAQADVPPLGINVFLDKEVDAANIDKTLQMVRDGGYSWVRQAFSWYDIEITAKGDFTDTRNGRNVSAWAKYDTIVARCQAYGLQIMARIDAPPGWAHADGKVSHDPPVHYSDYADFVATLVARYKGKIRYFQLWNEPNLEGEWGGRPNAAEYTALLKAAYTAAKRANPDVVILMAPLAPTQALTVSNINDLVFLQQMYDAGAKDAFDIANVMVYGLGYSPEERRTDFERLNFSRPILTRQVMERNGDGGKAIWASEYGWISLPPDWTGKVSTWGQSVSEALQAQYLVGGYQRARAEWPWMGVMFVWNFRDPAPQANEPATYFQIVNSDFSPRPAYQALQNYARRFPVADIGAHRADSPALHLTTQWSGNGATLAASTIVTATTADAQATITFQGTRLDLLLGAGAQLIPLRLLLDGAPAPSWPVDPDGGGRAVLPAAGSGASDQSAPAPAWANSSGGTIWRLTVASRVDGTTPHTFTLQPATAGAPLTLVGFIVSRDPSPFSTWGFPLAYLGLTLLLGWTIGRLLFHGTTILEGLGVGGWEVVRGRRGSGIRDQGSGEERDLVPRTSYLIPRTNPHPPTPNLQPPPPIAAVAGLPTLPAVPAVVALGGLLAIYYWSPWQPGAWAALVGWLVVAFLRPDVALGVVLATVPFLFQPRQLGPWQFALAETTLLLTFIAVLARRVLGLPAGPSTAPPSALQKARLHPDVTVAAPSSVGATVGSLPAWARGLLAVRTRWAAWQARDTFAAPALAFVLIGAFSLLTVADPGYLKNSLHEYRWTIIEPIIFYFLATDVLKGRAGAWRLADGLLAGATLAASGALLFAALGTVVLPVEGVSRVFWPYEHPNNLALLLGRAGPFAACVALFLTSPGEGLRRRLYALACVPLFVALALTFSRGAYVGVAVAALVVAGVAGWRRVQFALGGMAAAGAVLLLVDRWWHFLPTRLVGAGSTVLRFGLWRSALHMLRDHPIFGVGLDQFLPQYEGFYVEQSNDYESSTSHPHNFILDFWLRLGIIGLIALGWTLVRFVRLAIPLARTADPVRKALALGLLAVMTDFVVHGLIDNAYFLMDLAFIFWAGCALLQILRAERDA